MTQDQAIEIFNEITAIYDAQVISAAQIVTDHQSRLARRTVAQAFAYLAPPPDIGTADWMDEHVYLPAGMTATPGKWHTDRRPFLRGIADAFNNPMIETVTVEKASRMGITMLINGDIGRQMHTDPCSMMFSQQTLGETKKYYYKILRPFISATAALRDIIPFGKSRAPGTSIYEIPFSGGSLTLVGGNVATGFRQVFIVRLYLDDVDGFAWTVGKEGDPIKNAIGRTTGIWNRKIIIVSKPTLKGWSRIHQSYEQSDQQLYHVPCPHCDHGQTLRFGGKDLPFGLKWEHDDPYSAYYLCEQCGGVIRDYHKKDMLTQGKWIPTVTPKDPRHAGFGGLSHLYHPDVMFSNLAKDFLACGNNPEHLQVFVNDVLGECWDDKGEGLNENALFARREDWVPGELPEGIAMIDGAADVGENHIACGIEGWGRGMENWKVNYQLFEGDTLLPEIWESLRKYVMETWKHYCGIQLRPMVFMIDSRYRGEMVGTFVQTMRRCGVDVIAIQGATKPKSGEIMTGTVPSKKNARLKVHLYNINDDASKLSVLARLRVPKPGGGYVHFPKEEWCNADYFDQLLSEKKVRVREKGIVKELWIQKPGVRNEPLDVAKYCLSGVIYLQKHKRFDLDKAADSMALRVEAEKLNRIERGELPSNEYFEERARKVQEKVKAEKAKRQLQKSRRGGFVTNWRR